MFGSPEIFPKLLCFGVFFLFSFRIKLGVPFRFFLCLTMRWQRQTDVGFCVKKR